MLLSDSFATNPLFRADGSAVWTTGKTKVIVSINGPIEVPRRDELVSETTIDIQFRPVSGYPGPHEKALEFKLRQFISSIVLRTLNPRSLVQVVIQVLSVDPASFNSTSTILTTAINAVMLGLLSTPSIPLRTTISAIEVVRAQGTSICHPTETQRRQATSTHVLGFDNNSRELVVCESWGEFTIEEFDNVVQIAKEDRGVETVLREEVKKMLGVVEGS